MATIAARTRPASEWAQVELADVSWETYCQLRDVEENNPVRMLYLMSPEIAHESPRILLGQLVRAVAMILNIGLREIGSTTLRRRGQAKQGAGKEPDTAFYLGEDEARMRRAQSLDLANDPPPSLAIEVDNTRNSVTALAVYARLGVPELWRYSTSSRSVWIGRLAGDDYQEVARSVALPLLTPTLVVEALDRYEVGDLDESAWFEWIKAWARTLPGPDALV